MFNTIKCPACNAELEITPHKAMDVARCGICTSRLRIRGRAASQIPFVDYYSVLGIPDSASDEDVSKAVRTGILENHPDRNPDDNEAEGRLIRIIEARDALEDPVKRKEYDLIYHALPLPRYVKKVQAPKVISTSESYDEINHLKSQVDGIDSVDLRTSKPLKYTWIWMGVLGFIGLMLPGVIFTAIILGAIGAMVGYALDSKRDPGESS